MNKFNQEYRYHHMGIPTTEIRPNEKFSEVFGMYTSDVDGDFRIQYHRFTEDSPLHPLIKTVPHVAIQVNNLDKAVEGHEILLGPYEPILNYRVVIINNGGVPVELVETSLTPLELWGKASNQKDLDTSGL
ncbi:hypothetical protein IR083_18820 [Dysgonomonas sp. GY75]|uniref:VOC family protein n=1 Tax=Dysgonomonas sp. GY75 TaxID=2780419 RepID=UPI0018839D65|nr:hypothetical protein [Dysgonomonas sp. GY75]MBF0650874.1 hypothetical protein [Dysgonomonas sp. GY75]